MNTFNSNQFYARYVKFDEIIHRQPLKEHISGVRKNMLSFGDGDFLSSTSSLLASLHDAGKYRPAFQSYLFEESRNAKINHAYYGAFIFMIMMKVKPKDDFLKNDFKFTWLKEFLKRNPEYRYQEQGGDYYENIVESLESISAVSISNPTNLSPFESLKHSVYVLKDFMVAEYISMVTNVLISHHSSLKDVIGSTEKQEGTLLASLSEPKNLFLNSNSGLFNEILNESSTAMTFFKKEIMNIGELIELIDESFKEFLNFTYGVSSRVLLKNNQLTKLSSSEPDSKLNSIKKLKKQCNIQTILITKYLYSSLINADRLDAANWAESKINKVNVQKSKIKAFLQNRKCRIEIWTEMLKALENHIFLKREEFEQNLFQKTPKERAIFDLRNKFSKEVVSQASEKSGIFQLTLPTGSGKNFTSLHFALKHALENNLEQLFIILPYTTIIEQNVKELKSAFEGMFYEGIPLGDFILEYHSNVSVELTSTTEHTDSNDVIDESWNYPIVVTTMVQYLNAWFTNKSTFNKNLIHFRKSFFIFDEIQALDIKHLYAFKETLNFLVHSLSCSVVLSTATQPEIGDVGLYHNQIPLLNSETFHFVIKELITLSTQEQEVFERTLYKPLGDKIEKRFTIEQLATVIGEISKEEDFKNLLIVSNYKKDAQSLYLKLKELHRNTSVKVFHLSTNMYPVHRKRVLKSILEALAAKEEVICVSTSLIEAGINISFEKVLKEINRIDSIVQAGGRGNRYGEYNLGEVFLYALKSSGRRMKSNYELHQTLAFRLLSKMFEQSTSLRNVDLEKFNFSYLHNEFEFNEKAFQKLNQQMSIGLFSGVFNKLYQSAGKEFKVINNALRTIIIKHKDDASTVECLIEQRKFKLLQQYSINVSESEFIKLKKSGLLTETQIKKHAIYIVENDNNNLYSDEIGYFYKCELEAHIIA